MPKNGIKVILKITENQSVIIVQIKLMGSIRYIKYDKTFADKFWYELIKFLKHIII